MKCGSIRASPSCASTSGVACAPRPPPRFDPDLGRDGDLTKELAGMSVAPTVDVAGERAPGVEPRARAKTAGRRATEQRLRNLGIRAVSLAVFLGAWQWLGQGGK